MFGIQPELDETASLYEALRFDDERKPIAEIIQKTNVPNLNIVPANLVLQEYEYDGLCCTGQIWDELTLPFGFFRPRA